MGAIIAGIGLAVAGAGTGLAAAGASKNAKALAKEQKRIAQRETEFAGQWTTQLDQLVSDKRQELSNLGTIFDRMTSSGAFGDTDTLRNLRQTQEDFSALAAGDFSGFESQLRSLLNEQYIRTAGSPVGAYTQLGAQTLFNLRTAGAQQAQSTTALLNDLSYQALGHEFGIMDQRFNTAYQIDRQRLNAINQAGLGQASTVGVREQAVGQGWQQFGSLMTNYGLLGTQSQPSSIMTYGGDIAPSVRTITDRPDYSSGAKSGLVSRPVSYSQSYTPSLPYGDVGYATGALLPQPTDSFSSYNSLLSASNVANSLSNVPYVGSLFGQLGQTGYNIASGMSF